MNWLFIRGLSRDQRHWEGLPGRFETSFKSSKSFCLDLPGFGTEHKRLSPTTISSILDDVRARWLKIKAKNPGEWNLVSISLGGMLAMEWCSKFPEDFNRCVVINSSAKNVASPLSRLKPKSLTAILKAIFIRDTVARERIILEMTTNMIKNHEEVARRWANYTRERAYTLQNVARQLLAASKYESPNYLSTPVLVLASQKDEFVNPSCSKRLANLFRSTIEIHPDAGHDLPLDDPNWILEKVSAWVASNNAVSATLEKRRQDHEQYADRS